MYSVYVLIFSNNKKYFGITSQKTEYRWNNGKGYKGSKLVYNAIQKYGWENIEHNILYSELNEQDAKEKERYLILKNKTYIKKYGYNLTLGGETVIHSIETRIKMSMSRTGKKNKPKTEEQKNKVRKRVMNLDTKIIYKSTLDAECKTNIDSSSISKVCRNERKTAGGYHWKYL